MICGLRGKVGVESVDGESQEIIRWVVRGGDIDTTCSRASR